MIDSNTMTVPDKYGLHVYIKCVLVRKGNPIQEFEMVKIHEGNERQSCIDAAYASSDREIGAMIERFGVTRHPVFGEFLSDRERSKLKALLTEDLQRISRQLAPVGRGSKQHTDLASESATLVRLLARLLSAND